MNLPGNPHTDDAMNFSTEASLINEWPSTERAILAQQATAHATLALAYEVRTANLQREREQASRMGDGETMYSIGDRISERLGLGAAND